MDGAGSAGGKGGWRSGGSWGGYGYRWWTSEGGSSGDGWETFGGSGGGGASEGRRDAGFTQGKAKVSAAKGSRPEDSGAPAEKGKSICVTSKGKGTSKDFNTLSINSLLITHYLLIINY